MSNHTLVSLFVLVLASGCAPDSGGHSALTGPSTGIVSPTPPPVPPQDTTQAPRPIGVGEEVNDALTFHGAERLFELTAPSDGVLVVRLMWPPDRGRLELATGELRWTGAGVIAATIRVAAGRKYQLSVADGAPWDYGDFFVPFVLTTSIEKASK